MVAAVMAMKHDVAPDEAIQKSVGDLSAIELYSNQILVAVYVRPEKTASGLYLADSTRKEDEYQGKTGLVLKKGPQAFEDDDRTSFKGQNVEVGDWIVTRASDGWSLKVNGVLCRIVHDVDVKLRIPAPDAVF